MQKVIGSRKSNNSNNDNIACVDVVAARKVATLDTQQVRCNLLRRQRLSHSHTCIDCVACSLSRSFARSGLSQFVALSLLSGSLGSLVACCFIISVRLFVCLRERAIGGHTRTETERERARERERGREAWHQHTVSHYLAGGGAGGGGSGCSSRART